MTNQEVIKVFETVKLEFLNPRDLICDNYQRPTDSPKSKKLINDMSLNFNPYGFGAVTVNRRADGTMVVEDGQHRVLFAVQKGLSKIPCLVTNNLCKKDECGIFEAKNNEKPLTSLDKFRVKFVEGSVKEKAIVSVLMTHGFYFPKLTEAKLYGTRIKAVDAIDYAYTTLNGSKGLDLLCTVINRSWSHDKKLIRTAMQNRYIKGLSVFLKLYGDKISQDTLVRKLKSTTPDAIANNYLGKIAAGNFTKYAEAILGVYNVGLKNKLPNKFIG